MTDPNGWPDASKPGVPLNSERDGWHWVCGLPSQWVAELAMWRGEGGFMLRPETWRALPYGGPCHTPAEVAALVAAGQERGVKRAARIARAADDVEGACKETVGMVVRAIEFALSRDVAPDALARIRAEAERRGMERAAKMMERLLDFPLHEPGELRSSDIPELARRFAAAIRDEAKEIKP